MNIDTEEIDESEDYSSARASSLLSATVFLCDCVPVECAGMRLDQALVHLLPDYSRSRLQSWIRSGQASVNDAICDQPKYKLWGGERLRVVLLIDERDQPYLPEAIALAIQFEDEHIIVIDKPAGLVVHPGSGNWSGTLLNALLHHDPALAALPRAGIVHRLDKETSGLIVVAKTLAAQTDLVRQLQARTVGREYLALARGLLYRSATIDAPLARHPRQKTKMAVVDNGKPARTHYRVTEHFFPDTTGCTLLECRLETGRTHQIRVHLAHIGHPLVGDTLYAGRHRLSSPPFHRQALHARRLQLVHPISRETLSWQAPLPADFSALLDSLRIATGERNLAAADEDYTDD